MVSTEFILDAFNKMFYSGKDNRGPHQSDAYNKFDYNCEESGHQESVINWKIQGNQEPDDDIESLTDIHEEERYGCKTIIN